MKIFICCVIFILIINCLSTKITSANDEEKWYKFKDDSLIKIILQANSNKEARNYCQNYHQSSLFKLKRKGDIKLWKFLIKKKSLDLKKFWVNANSLSLWNCSFVSVEKIDIFNANCSELLPFVCEKPYLENKKSEQSNSVPKNEININEKGSLEMLRSKVDQIEHLLNKNKKNSSDIEMMLHHLQNQVLRMNELNKNGLLDIKAKTSSLTVRFNQQDEELKKINDAVKIITMNELKMNDSLNEQMKIKFSSFQDKLDQLSPNFNNIHGKLTYLQNHVLANKKELLDIKASTSSLMDKFNQQDQELKQINDSVKIIAMEESKMNDSLTEQMKIKFSSFQDKFNELFLNFNKLKSSVEASKIEAAKIIDSYPKEKNITANENSLISLACIAKGNPEPEIIWTHKGKVLENKKSNLSLLAARGSDGIIECLANNNIGFKDKLSFNLKVFHIPSISFKESQSQSKISNDFALTCEYDGYPIPVITWKLNSSYFRESQNYKIDNSKTGETTVIIKNFNEKLVGNYECCAHNSYGLNCSQKFITGFTPFDLTINITKFKSYKHTLQFEAKSTTPNIMFEYEITNLSGNLTFKESPKKYLISNDEMKYSFIDRRKLEFNSKYNIILTAVNSYGKQTKSQSFISPYICGYKEIEVTEDIQHLISHKEFFNDKPYKDDYECETKLLIPANKQKHKVIIITEFFKMKTAPINCEDQFDLNDYLSLEINYKNDKIEYFLCDVDSNDFNKEFKANQINVKFTSRNIQKQFNSSNSHGFKLSFRLVQKSFSFKTIINETLL